MYPHDREVPKHILQELLGILVHAGVGTSELAPNVVWLTNSKDWMTSSDSLQVIQKGRLTSYWATWIISHRLGGTTGFLLVSLVSQISRVPLVFSHKISQAA